MFLDLFYELRKVYDRIRVFSWTKYRKVDFSLFV